jgi:hypothetical protein
MAAPAEASAALARGVAVVAAPERGGLVCDGTRLPAGPGAILGECSTGRCRPVDRLL